MDNPSPASLQVYNSVRRAERKAAEATRKGYPGQPEDWYAAYRAYSNGFRPAKGSVYYLNGNGHKASSEQAQANAGRAMTALSPTQIELFAYQLVVRRELVVSLEYARELLRGYNPGVPDERQSPLP